MTTVIIHIKGLVGLGQISNFQILPVIFEWMSRKSIKVLDFSKINCYSESISLIVSL